MRNEFIQTSFIPIRTFFSLPLLIRSNTTCDIFTQVYIVQVYVTYMIVSTKEKKTPGKSRLMNVQYSITNPPVRGFWINLIEPK